MAAVMLWMLLLCLIMADYSTLAVGIQIYPCSILLFDAALVFNLRERYHALMVCTFLLYLHAAIYDMYTDRFFKKVHPDGEAWLCQCEDPPCRIPSSLLPRFVFGANFVILVDLYLTRGFANAMRQQMSLVRLAIEVTENIAEQLAMYEVDEGRALLQSDGGSQLPPRLRVALHRLLDNLDGYRPYLPDHVMLRDDDGVQMAAVEPPGFGQLNPDITVCFTDIQSSTELWESHPQAMHAALQLHNTVIRQEAAERSGYEVKVIGDSFMLAFGSTEDACGFGIDVQVALVDAKWPSDLLLHPLCKPVPGESGYTLWNGPRIRIGVHCGAVKVDKNPVTGRCDYFGPPVNTAARVEQCLRHGGLTGVTGAVLEALTPGAMLRLGDPLRTDMGAKELKGVATPVHVTALLSPLLAGREELVSKDTRRVSHSLVMHSSEGSGSSLMSASGGRRHVRTVDVSRLPRRVGTCACFRAPPDCDLTCQGCTVGDMLEQVEQAADATQGVVAGTLSVHCVVMWNGPRSCPDHYGQCLRAVDQISRSGTLAVGACTGDVVYGTLAAGRKKHAAVVGGCVELSQALAEAAEAGAERALAATSFGMYCATLRRTRRFGLWSVVGMPDSLSVWALLPPREDDFDECDDGRVSSSPHSYTLESPRHSTGARRSAGQTPAKQVLLGAGLLLPSEQSLCTLVRAPW
eukprot:TRINITY_DN8084_c0_g2_i6.p1 TRINITY_DN8084_c0_g2~~TRINITY_DN8084_c0_g2_i6.p1  ORF type:complete len:795 (+),score=193.64 TRINITY_DN8084_c0_g2_i6:316-2385(+)